MEKMKKIIILIFATFISINAFSQTPVDYIPYNSDGLLHVNVSKIFGTINTDYLEEIILNQVKILPSQIYDGAKKLFKEVLPQLKEAGFDLYKDLNHVLVTGRTKGSNTLLIVLKGNFTKEVFNKIFIEIARAKRISMFRQYEIYKLGDTYIKFTNDNTLLLGARPHEIVRAVQTKKSGRDISNNPNYKYVYSRSPKNKALNIFYVVNRIPQNEQRRNQGGQMGMLLMFLQNLKGISLTIDLPRNISINANIFCKDPNTAASIGMLIQQQLPNLPATVRAELVKTNREIAIQTRKVKQNVLGAGEKLLMLKYKKFFLLLASYASNKIRVITRGLQVFFNFTWPKSYMQRALTASRLNINLNRLLR